MGVDVGTKLHVVIREPLKEEGEPSLPLFIGEVDGFVDLTELVKRYNVQMALVDALPEQRLVLAFAREHWQITVGVAYYDSTEPQPTRTRKGGVFIYHLNRTLALEEMFATFHSGTAGLPRDARLLGGRVKNGLGEYYREMLALSRVREQDAEGNWFDRYVDGGKPDHYAHAETYCHVALDYGRQWFRAFWE